MKNDIEFIYNFLYFYDNGLNSIMNSKNIKKNFSLRKNQSHENYVYNEI